MARNKKVQYPTFNTHGAESVETMIRLLAGIDAHGGLESIEHVGDAQQWFWTYGWENLELETEEEIQDYINRNVPTEVKNERDYQMYKEVLEGLKGYSGLTGLRED